MDRSRAGSFPDAVLSIGALSRATGVPTETLRTWERRYGFPRPVQRSGSGHRRYPIQVVEQTRLAVRAMELGHKPAVALRADEPTLRQLIELHEPPEASPRTVEAAPLPQSGLDEWFRLVERFDEDGLHHVFRRSLNQQGALGFLKRSCGPFLTELGRRWEVGSLEVAHEHFASEKLRDFLSTEWRPLSEHARGGRIVCATPPDEQHVIGLHMAALAMATADSVIIFLGANTPASDVVTVLKERRAQSIALSASSSSSRRQLMRYLNKLAQQLPEDVPIVVGGTGFEKVAHPRTMKIPDLERLAEWARSLAADDQTTRAV